MAPVPQCITPVMYVSFSIGQPNNGYGCGPGVDLPPRQTTPLGNQESPRDLVC
jgi:hypothetical protein